MNSFKDSDQGRRMREWQRDQRRRQELQYQSNLPKQHDWIKSPAYLAARQKAIKDKVHAYLIIACGIAAIGVLMFWP